MNATTPTPEPTLPEQSDELRPAGRVRSCVGCGARGGGFGRGAHVHARPECLRRAVERGLSRSAKARVHTIQTDAADPAAGTVPLDVQSLAQAIQRAMDRRIEGLLSSASRSKQVFLGADAVSGASHRGEADLVLVATDAAAAADLSAVRLAVAEGRAVAWGTKARLGELLFRAGSGRALGVLAVASRSLAGSLGASVRIADACATVVAGTGAKGIPAKAERRGSKEPRLSSSVAAEGGNSQSLGACAPPPNSGKLDASKGASAPPDDGESRALGRHQEKGGAPRMAERAPSENRVQDGQRNARERGQRSARPGAAPAKSQGARRVDGHARGRREDG